MKLLVFSCKIKPGLTSGIFILVSNLSDLNFKYFLCSRAICQIGIYQIYGRF